MFQKLKLKNGTRVILIPDDRTKAATVLVLYRVGSRYEPQKTNGMSHFIEHMMFKGTTRRPKTADISRELDAVGAEYNAFTSKDMTGYYVKIAGRHLPLAVDMLHDMLYRSKFEEKEVERERKVIMEEIHMYQDNPMMHIEDMIESEIFAGSPLGWHIAGNRATMDECDRASLVRFRDAYYIPSRTVVVLAGNLGSDALSLIQKLFGTVRTRKEAKAFSTFRSRQSAPRVAVEFKETEQIQLALGFPAFSHADKRLPALGVLANIMGGTMSSRLFINVREKRGLAYFVRAAAEPYEDTGSFQVRAGLTKSRIDEAIRTICAELRKVRERGVSAAELIRAKENIRGKLTLELEDSSDLAGFYGKQELFTRTLRSPEERMAEVDAVTLGEVRAVATEVFRRDRASLALIGPFKEKERFGRLITV